ncbi:unnamed protein product [Nyctereutes procyonoides]|uniref:(raccoon dog) hypothetical protein n=1 Tax=Nyctereutes procyonoides TaxID=34880 RepID=A0A811Z9Y2_NYCPR|nr:unnamed protein product [Nyctereutes procyonoides]
MVFSEQDLKGVGKGVVDRGFCSEHIRGAPGPGPSRGREGEHSGARRPGAQPCHLHA